MSTSSSRMRPGTLRLRTTWSSAASVPDTPTVRGIRTSAAGTTRTSMALGPLAGAAFSVAAVESRLHPTAKNDRIPSRAMDRESIAVFYMEMGGPLRTPIPPDSSRRFHTVRTFAYHPDHDEPRRIAMPLTELNHYFVRANDLESTKDFYCDVLGLQVMPRPTFPFPGYWLGVNGKIQVHMGPHGIDNADMYYLGTPKDAVTDHAGVVDHIAFLANEPGGFIRRFRERGIEYQPRSLPEFDLYQIFIKDPNGLTIELNFFGLKEVTDWGGENYSKMP